MSVAIDRHLIIQLGDHVSGQTKILDLVFMSHDEMFCGGFRKKEYKCALGEPILNFSCETVVSVWPVHPSIVSSCATGHFRKSSCFCGNPSVLHYSVSSMCFVFLCYTSVRVLSALSYGDVSLRMKHCNCHDWLSDQFNRHSIIQGEKHSKPFPIYSQLIFSPLSFSTLFFCLSPIALPLSSLPALQYSSSPVVDKQFEVILKLNFILAVGGAGEEISSSGLASVCVCVSLCVVGECKRRLAGQLMW